jgi:hypothetical protein
MKWANVRNEHIRKSAAYIKFLDKFGTRGLDSIE